MWECDSQIEPTRWRSRLLHNYGGSDCSQTRSLFALIVQHVLAPSVSGRSTASRPRLFDRWPFFTRAISVQCQGGRGNQNFLGRKPSVLARKNIICSQVWVQRLWRHFWGEGSEVPRSRGGEGGNQFFWPGSHRFWPVETSFAAQFGSKLFENPLFEGEVQSIPDAFEGQLALKANMSTSWTFERPAWQKAIASWSVCK